jgi:hypothetical protein
MQHPSKHSIPVTRAAATRAGFPEHPIIWLQRAAGNQAVLRWLRPRDVPVDSPSEPEERPVRAPVRKRRWFTLLSALVLVVFVAYLCYEFVLRQA